MSDRDNPRSLVEIMNDVLSTVREHYDSEYVYYIEKEYEDIKKEVIKELKKELRPEFINRIDEIIVFHKLSEEDIKQITNIMLKQVEERLKNQKYIVEIDDGVVKAILKQGYDNNFGARPLRRTIQNLVEDRISEEILSGNLKKNKKWILKI